MLLFLDFDGVLQPLGTPTGPGRARAYVGPPLPYASLLAKLLAAYLPSLSLIISSTWARNRTVEAIRDLLPSALSARVIGTLWQVPPPRPLARYEHIRFWLKREYVTWAPGWLALDDDDRGWPDDARRHLIHCTSPIDDPAIQDALRTRLRGYTWPERWWGDAPGPSTHDLRRAWQLMLIWQIRDDARQSLLGTTRDAFQERLSLLLTIFAAPRWPTRTKLGWPGQWLYLPCSALGGERPLDVMQRRGVEGIREIHDLVWSSELSS